MTTTRINHTGHNHPATPAGRAACRDAANVALNDAVNAYRTMCRWAKVRKNSAEWRKSTRDFRAAAHAYAALVSMANADAMEKVATIARMLPTR